ncbi:MAG: hypothetical protein R3D43_01585 [Tepidamorphaceae bacterium]|nr:hypothetical protein [Rhodobiaceae bacterium]MCC0047604.1 hypothetical protein [Rhodobiaceae bacterium]
MSGGKNPETFTIAVACMLLAAGCLAATPVQAADLESGRRVVEKWCSQCHAQKGAETNPDRGPTYEQIASREGRNERYIRAFLDRDHFPMTTYRLFDHEKDDVAAFIASLARR